MPKMRTKARDAIPITTTAIPHWGNNSPSSLGSTLGLGSNSPTTEIDHRSRFKEKFVNEMVKIKNVPLQLYNKQ